MSYEQQPQAATPPAQPIAEPTTYPTAAAGPAYEERQLVRPAKTSAAAVFSLVFGVSALFSVLTVILGPLGIVLGIVGILLATFGIRNAKRVGVTGRGVAVGGLALSVIAVLLGAALALGVTFFLNDQRAVDRLEQQLQDWRDQLPSDVNIQQ